MQKMDKYSPRQLCALLWTALAAPLVTVASAVSWPWVLAALAAAGLLYYSIGILARKLPSGLGAAPLLREAWGKGARWLGLLSWAWLTLAAALAASMAVTAFPQDNAYPLIPLVLLILAAVAAAEGSAAACRFGATLFLAVAPLLALVLAFGAFGVEWEHLIPAGEPRDALAPLAVLALPGAAFFFRDGLTGRETPWKRWFFLLAALALAVSTVTVGFLGLPLARASANAFWYMSRSISVLGVMERFEAVISAFLAISFCTLLGFLLTAAQKTLCCAAPNATPKAAVWVTAAAAGLGLWVVPRVPEWAFLVGNLLFWGVFPLATLLVVHWKKIRKKAKKALTNGE